MDRRDQQLVILICRNYRHITTVVRWGFHSRFWVRLMARVILAHRNNAEKSKQHLTPSVVHLLLHIQNRDVSKWRINGPEFGERHDLKLYLKSGRDKYQKHFTFAPRQSWRSLGLQHDKDEIISKVGEKRRPPNVSRTGEEPWIENEIWFDGSFQYIWWVMTGLTSIITACATQTWLNDLFVKSFDFCVFEDTLGAGLTKSPWHLQFAPPWYFQRKSCDCISGRWYALPRDMVRRWYSRICRASCSPDLQSPAILSCF